MRLPFRLHIPAEFHRKWRIVGICIILLCLIFTIGFWLIIEDSNNRIAAERLATDKQRVLESVERRLEIYSDVLYGGRALFMINPNLSRTDWDTFMESQNLFERYPGLNTIAFAKATNRAGVPAAIEHINKQLLPGEPEARFYPETVTKDYAIIQYSTQVAEFQILGLNAYAREPLVAMFDTAIASSVPVASPPHDSRNPARKGTKDVIVVLAVYNPTFRDTMTPVEKRQALIGFIAASIHPQTLFERSVQLLTKPEEVAIEVTGSDGATVYSYGSDFIGDRIAQESTINVGGQPWNVVFSAPADYDLTPRQVIAPPFFLIVGLLFMLLCASAFFYWTGVRIQRTKRLRQDNQQNK